MVKKISNAVGSAVTTTADVFRGEPSNGKPKLSFGRIAAAAIIAAGLLISYYNVHQIHQNPNTVVSSTQAMFDPQTGRENPITYTYLVSKVDWTDMGKWGLMFVLPLAAFMYNGSKVLTIVEIYVKGQQAAGKPVLPKNPQQ